MPSKRILGAQKNQFDYVVHEIDSVIYAKNGRTGVIDYGGSHDAGGVDGGDAFEVINASRLDLASTGGLIALARGNFDIGSSTLEFDHGHRLSIGLIGAGERASVLTSTENRDMIDLTDSRVRLENLGLFMNGGAGNGIVSTPPNAIGARSCRLHNLRIWGIDSTHWAIHLKNLSGCTLSNFDLWRVGNGLLLENTSGSTINYGNSKIDGNNRIHIDSAAGICAKFLSTSAPSHYMNLIHVDKLECKVYSGISQSSQQGLVFDGARNIQCDYIHLERLYDGIRFDNTPVDIEILGGYLGKTYITNEIVGTGTRCFVGNMAQYRTYTRGVETGFAVDSTGEKSSTFSHGCDRQPNNVKLTVKKATDVTDYRLGYARYSLPSATQIKVDIYVQVASSTEGATIDIDWEADAREIKHERGRISPARARMRKRRSWRSRPSSASRRVRVR